MQVRLLDSIANTQQEFQDIGQRLNQITDLPQGAGPITWISDFGDTAALMLTVASPTVPDIEIELRARGVREAIEKAARGHARDERPLFTVIQHPSHLRHLSGHSASSLRRHSTTALRTMFVRCPWEAVPESILRLRSQTPRSAVMRDNSWRSSYRNTTSIPTRGVRSSFATRNPQKNVSQKLPVTGIRIDSLMTLPI